MLDTTDKSLLARCQGLPATTERVPTRERLRCPTSPRCFEEPGRLSTNPSSDRVKRFESLNDTTGHEARVSSDPVGRCELISDVTGREERVSSDPVRRFVLLNDVTGRESKVFRKSPGPPHCRRSSIDAPTKPGPEPRTSAHTQKSMSLKYEPSSEPINHQPAKEVVRRKNSDLSRPARTDAKRLKQRQSSMPQLQLAKQPPAPTLRARSLPTTALTQSFRSMLEKEAGEYAAAEAKLTSALFLVWALSVVSLGVWHVVTQL